MMALLTLRVIFVNDMLKLTLGFMCIIKRMEEQVLLEM